MTSTFEVQGQTYQARPLSAFQQLEVATRVGLALSGMADIKRDQPGAEPRRQRQALCALLGRAAPAEVSWVTHLCLSVVTRQSGQGWAPVVGPVPGQTMFQDLDLEAIMGLLWHVLEANRLPDFFDVPPPPSGGSEGGSS